MDIGNDKISTLVLNWNRKYAHEPLIIEMDEQIQKWVWMSVDAFALLAIKVLGKVTEKTCPVDP